VKRLQAEWEANSAIKRADNENRKENNEQYFLQAFAENGLYNKTDCYLISGYHTFMNMKT
jgi:hypothetical protein